MANDDGFINPRTGKYVSSMRAHQHVGESIEGYEKARSKSTGNFYMRPTSSIESLNVSNPFLSMQTAVLEAQIMQTYASMYTDAMNSAIESLDKMTRDMETDSKDRVIKQTFKAVLKEISSYRTFEALGNNSDTLATIQSLMPEDQIELFRAAGDLDDLKRSFDYVLFVLKKGKTKLDKYYWKKDSYSASEDKKAKARESYYRLDSIRSSRRKAFKVMRKAKASKEKRDAAVVTFWQTVDAELAIIDESGWRDKKLREALLLADYGALEQSMEILEHLGDHPEVQSALSRVKLVQKERENEQAYDAANEMLDRQEFVQAVEAFRALGKWKDSPERLAEAEKKLQNWQNETYIKAIKDFDEGRYAESRDAFKSLGNYLDSRTRLQTSSNFVNRAEKYKKAEEYEQKGDYRRARDQFKRIATFKDAEARAQHCQELFEKRQKELYDDAKADFDAKRYTQCIKKLKALGSYSNAQKLISDAKRLLQQVETLELAKAHFKAGMFDEARIELNKPHMQGSAAAEKMLGVVEDILQLKLENSELDKARKALEKSRNELKTKQSQTVSRKQISAASQNELMESEKQLAEIESSLAMMNLFSFREKKRLRALIEDEQARQQKLKDRIPHEIAQRDADIEASFKSMQDDIDTISRDIAAMQDTIEHNYRKLQQLAATY